MTTSQLAQWAWADSALNLESNSAGTVLFPHALLPLYIFEPRYREMLQRALDEHRMFSVTLVKPSCPEWQEPEDFFHLAAVGLIRACVERSDGTSNLILQGLERVR